MKNIVCETLLDKKCQLDWLSLVFSKQNYYNQHYFYNKQIKFGQKVNKRIDP